MKSKCVAPLLALLLLPAVAYGQAEYGEGGGEPEQPQVLPNLPPSSVIVERAREIPRSSDSQCLERCKMGCKDGRFVDCDELCDLACAEEICGECFVLFESKKICETADGEFSVLFDCHEPTGLVCRQPCFYAATVQKTCCRGSVCYQRPCSTLIPGVALTPSVPIPPP